ncbi:MAG: hypothetical protein IJ525_07100 [Alphaproteobacteria bacterium]|nr:hypothetical protein [Alphaproteobacteria bacterium]
MNVAELKESFIAVLSTFINIILFFVVLLFSLGEYKKTIFAILLVMFYLYRVQKQAYCSTIVCLLNPWMFIPVVLSLYVYVRKTSFSKFILSILLCFIISVICCDFIKQFKIYDYCKTMSYKESIILADDLYLDQKYFHEEIVDGISLLEPNINRPSLSGGIYYGAGGSINATEIWCDYEYLPDFCNREVCFCRDIQDGCLIINVILGYKSKKFLRICDKNRIWIDSNIVERIFIGNKKYTFTCHLGEAEYDIYLAENKYKKYIKPKRSILKE